MKEKHETLSIEDISFDTENPRIKNSLEKYGDKVNPERIHFALRAASENGAGGTSSYQSLEYSIRANGKVAEPIRVIKRDGKYTCIDGNTRLAIYRKFRREESDKWSHIEAIVLENASDRDIDTIRICAHLVGARQWPAYEKAQYLHHLRNSYFMDYDEIIALCGGKKPEIERQIDAYSDMNEYYRDIVDDSAFHIDRFSGFVELQKPKIKEAIFDAELDLKNFGEWIRDGKIYRLADVRQLPRVLGDDEAKEIFLEGGLRSIEEAGRFLDHKQTDSRQTNRTTLKSASLQQLAKFLLQKIDGLTYAELQSLRNKDDGDVAEQVSTLESLSAQLQKLLEDVSE